MNNKTDNRYSFKNFLPLIIIFSIIITFTIVKALFTNSWIMQPIMMDFMGAFFIIFGAFKVMNLKNFAQAYAEYDLIAKRSRLYALAYPFIELTLGIVYLLHINSIFINSATLLLMLVSAAGVMHELLQHKQIVCACLGTVFKIPMTYVTLLEDLLMAAMALWMISKMLML